jgi:hypothetical protein
MIDTTTLPQQKIEMEPDWYTDLRQRLFGDTSGRCLVCDLRGSNRHPDGKVGVENGYVGVLANLERALSVVDAADFRW